MRSLITKGLYVSGMPDQSDTGDCDLVVNLVGGPCFLRPGLEYVIWLIDDGSMPDPSAVQRIAKHVHEVLAAGKTVLVHCGAGINRANLIACRALMYGGMKFEDALRLLREKRDSAVLSNHQFTAWLETEG